MIIGNANRALIDFQGKVLAIDNITGTYLHPHGCILMQYTGLRDKNGKDIYEGDVVISFGKETEMTISEMRMIVDDAMNCYVPLRDQYLNSNGDLEVIGNIYENPELLRQA